MDKLHIISVATESKYYFPYLLESCKRNGKNLEVLGNGEKWKGFSWRYELMINYLKNIPSDHIVCFVDGYDVICCKNLNNIVNDFLEIKKRTGCKIIVGSDIPIKTRFLSYIYFGTCKNKLINSGTYLGYASDILEILTNIYNLNPDSSNDDQILMTKYCQKNDKEIYIDTENLFFLSISSPLEELDKYVEIDKNTHELKYNSNKPYFIHANGYGYLNNVISKLGYTIEKDYIKKELSNNFIEQKVWHYTKDFFIRNIIIILLLILLLIYFINFTYINNSVYKFTKNIKKCKNKYK
jgi:hypothetical protein